VLSMTGYGMASAELDGGKLVIEAKSVNHRFLEIIVRFPEEIARHSLVADGIARKLLDRGRVEIAATLENSAAGKLVLHKELARSAFRALRELGSEICPDQPIPLSLLSSVPGLFSMDSGASSEQVRVAVQTATELACIRLTEMRAREGAVLAEDLSRRVETVRELVQSIESVFPEVLESIRRKIRARIERIVAEAFASLNSNRMEQEVAILAERADVSEEITRLASHCDQFAHMIPLASGQIGRKMEFLLQEMGREVNTLGSKVPELEVTRKVLELKAELERMREQVQNVL
jgi:uncharacterized protein (TIGR00255 family)